MQNWMQRKQLLFRKMRHLKLLKSRLEMFQNMDPKQNWIIIQCITLVSFFSSSQFFVLIHNFSPFSIQQLTNSYQIMSLEDSSLVKVISKVPDTNLNQCYLGSHLKQERQAGKRNIAWRYVTYYDITHLDRIYQRALHMKTHAAIDALPHWRKRLQAVYYDVSLLSCVRCPLSSSFHTFNFLIAVYGICASI